MRVDVHHSDRCGGGERSEDGISDRVIAARRDGPYTCRVHLAVERLDFLNLLRQVEAIRKANITEISDAAQIVGIQVETEIERPHETRGVADLTRAMPRSRPVRDAEIGRDTNEPNIDFSEAPRQRRTHEGCYLRIARLLHRIVFAADDDIRTNVALLGHVSLSFDHTLSDRPFLRPHGCT